MDAAVNQQDRIGVLEELLNERYSVRAFLPKPVPRETIDHVLKVAQRTASWCNSQPWQVLIASGEAKERFRNAIYAEAASRSKDDHDFTPPRERFPALQHARHRQRRQDGVCETGTGELQFLRRAARRNHPHRRAARHL